MKFIIHFWLTLTLLIGVSFTTVNSKPSSIFNDDVNATAVEKVGKVSNGRYVAFLSYRRSTSKHLAMLLKILLSKEDISTFIDVEDLKAGHWDDQLTEGIKATPNFIFILSNGTLDRCIGDTNYADVVHQEIKTAVDSKRNIIPVFDDFTMPKATFSPEINEMMRFQGVEWNHSMVGVSMKRLMSYLKYH